MDKPLLIPMAWTILTATAAAASGLASLADLPVTGTALVPASQYRDASLGAARTGSPVDIALSVVGAFEGARQLIVQSNEGVESPSASRLTVIRDGLLDDAVRSERWDIALARTASGNWEIREVKKAWRCRRGGNTAGFAAVPCP